MSSRNHGKSMTFPAPSLGILQSCASPAAALLLLAVAASWGRFYLHRQPNHRFSSQRWRKPLEAKQVMSRIVTQSLLQSTEHRSQCRRPIPALCWPLALWRRKPMKSRRLSSIHILDQAPASSRPSFLLFLTFCALPLLIVCDFLNIVIL